MSKEKEVDRARKIDDRRRRTYDPARSIPQRRENVFHRGLFWAWDARVVPSKGMQLVSVGSRNQRLVKSGGHFHGPAVQIEKSFVKVTKLYRIKAIDLIKQTRPD